MSREVLDSIHSVLEQIPAIPDRVLDLREALSLENSSSAEVAALIERDQGLAARLMVLRRLPFFGTVTEVESVTDLVEILGHDKIARLVGLLSIIQELEPRDAEERQVAQAIWDHQRKTAEYAVRVAIGISQRRTGGVCNVRSYDRLYAYGLFHDVGELILVHHSAHRWVEVREQAREEGRPRIVVEREAFGFSHDEVGAAVLQKWGHSKRMVETVRNHHRPATIERPFVDFLHLGDVLCGLVEGPAGAGTKPEREILERHGVSLDDLTEFAQI